jgi:hypothetical protein
MLAKSIHDYLDKPTAQKLNGITMLRRSIGIHFASDGKQRDNNNRRKKGRMIEDSIRDSSRGGLIARPDIH